MTLSRSRALVVLAATTAIGGALRFYNLSWGAPYFHFHMDEHFVLGPADTLTSTTCSWAPTSFA